jgi:hypothetical protein
MLGRPGRLLCVTTAVVGSMGCFPAAAQTGQSTSVASSDGLEEVVVTVRRRE